MHDRPGARADDFAMALQDEQGECSRGGLDETLREHLRSRGLEVVYTPQSKAPLEPPNVWAIVVGVSKYRGDAINLRNAAKDAEDFAAALKIAAGRLVGNEKVRLRLLTTSDAAHLPTRANLINALKAAKKA
jgi:hypothetical protein